MISGTKKPTNTDKQKGLFYVEQILKHRIEKGKTSYLVKWVGFGPEANSWEPSDNFFVSLFIANLIHFISLEPGTS